METKKYSRLVAIVMLMVVVELVYSAAINDYGSPDAPKTEAQKYFDQIPIEKREMFIRYYLGKGLEEQGTRVFRSPRIASAKYIRQEFGEPPKNFSSDFLNWTKSEFELEDEHVVRMAYGLSLCIPPKGCYPDDIGSQCCPF